MADLSLGVIYVVICHDSDDHDTILGAYISEGNAHARVALEEARRGPRGYWGDPQVETVRVLDF